VEPGSDSGPTILANLAQHRNGTGPAAAGAGLAADSLTSLEGPTAWSRILEIENARLLRYRRPVTIVVADVEGLRRLAERLGEAPVQRLLPVIVDSFVRQTRTTDWIARVGEGRFRALLPETDEIQAINYVERVRTACEPWLASAAVPLNLAIGWSSPAASSDLDSAILRAEERMHADRQTASRLH
jgi:diguanylate cyclase (GGDEF)-like protein